MLENHQSVRKNSLIFATVLMILCRWEVSRRSVTKTQGTKEFEHRKLELYRMMMRDTTGLVLTYFVLRAWQAGLQRLAKRMFQIQTAKKPGIFKSIWREFKDYITPEKPMALKTFAPYAGEPVAPEFKNKKLYNSLDRMGVIRAFSWKKGLPRAERLKNFIYWAGYWISSIPTIFVSGTLLEAFNRRHGKTFMNSLRDWAYRRGKEQGTQNIETTQPQARIMNNKFLSASPMLSYQLPAREFLYGGKQPSNFHLYQSSGEPAKVSYQSMPNPPVVRMAYNNFLSRPYTTYPTPGGVLWS